MRFLLTLGFCLAAQSAMAHPGHIGDLAGHDHWVAGIALGLAGLVAIWGAVKGKKKDDVPEDTSEEEPA